MVNVYWMGSTWAHTSLNKYDVSVSLSLFMLQFATALARVEHVQHNDRYFIIVC